MSEGLVQGPYAAARVEFKPATFRTEGAELTTEPPFPTQHNMQLDCIHQLAWSPQLGKHCTPIAHCLSRLTSMTSDHN